MLNSNGLLNQLLAFKHRIDIRQIFKKFFSESPLNWIINFYNCLTLGMWLSPVKRLVWVQETAGSNPAIPIKREVTLVTSLFVFGHDENRRFAIQHQEGV